MAPGRRGTPRESLLGALARWSPKQPARLLANPGEDHRATCSCNPYSTDWRFDNPVRRQSTRAMNLRTGSSKPHHTSEKIHAFE